jgi:acyl-CoA thioesterase FadM
VIETFATTGAFEAVKDRGHQTVGVSNATDFLRPHRNGRLQVVAVPIQQARTQQLWQVEIRRPQDGKLIARGQVRLQDIDPERQRQPPTAWRAPLVTRLLARALPPDQRRLRSVRGPAPRAPRAAGWCGS